MKGLIIASWVLIGISGFGVLVGATEAPINSDTLVGILIFGFYAVFTYQAQNLLKK